MQNVCFINKPKGLTSFDVCYKMRKCLKTKAVGHTGTLDPNATGVMIILYDKTCKANPFLVADKKEYIAKVVFGYETDTLDIDGKKINECLDYKAPSKDKVIEAMNGFLGKSMQKPPMTSAIKINGKKLYEYQRANQEIEIPLREIEVFAIELLELDEYSLTFKTMVSSGTYIRSLCKDILAELNLIGTLEELTRTKINDIDLKDCDDLETAMNGQISEHKLIDLIAKRYKLVEADDVMAKKVKNGHKLRFRFDDSPIAIVQNDEVLAMYGLEDDGFYHSIRGLF